MPKPSLADALSRQKPRHGGPSCVICELIPTLDKTDQDALDNAMSDTRLTGTMIVRALEEYGVNVSISTLRRHRRRECASLRNVG